MDAALELFGRDEAQPLRRSLAALREAANAPNSLADPTTLGSIQAATLGVIGELDRIIAAINDQLAQRDAAVATTVDRLVRLGELGLLATVSLALILSLVIGRAWRRRMATLRSGVERVTQGDLKVRIDDRAGDEVGTLARTFNGMVGELQLLEDMKSQFVAVASHELRTPLTLIDGYCAILLGQAKEALSPWQRQRIELIHSQVMELLRLVQDLLDAERLQERALEPTLEPLEPERLAAGLIHDFEAGAKARGLELKLQIETGVPRTGLADVRALTRVLRNLLDNAIKYTAAGQVVVELSGDPDTLRLQVGDTGCGIPEAELHRIFQRFYQVPSDHSPRRGFGLGLSIVRGLVERNGGRIEAQSQPGVGSLFTIHWPIHRTAAA